MASNDTGAGPQDWKHGAARGSAKPVVQYGWQAEKDSEPGKRSWRWRKIGGSLALAGIVCMIAVLIWMIYPYRPIRVVLAGAGYETNLAVEHNAWCWGALAKLKERLEGSRVSSPWWHSGEIKVDKPRRLGDRADWDELAADLKGFKGFKGETLVLVLALHGGVDENGPYLFLDKVGYSGPGGILRIEEVLKLMEDVPEKNKVLVLEPAQISAHWSRGMLSNDFVRRLKDLEEQITQIKNLVVLCASDVDQHSWPSEQTGLTVFSDFLMKGLLGAADDAREGGNGDRRVSAWELAAYVRKKVPIWVNAAHNKAVQTPILLPTGDGQQRAEGIELALVKETDLSSPARRSLSPADLKSLGEAWEEWDDLGGKVPSPAVYKPHLWRQYRDTLLRYEQLLLAGSEEASTLRRMKDDLRKRLQADRKAGWRSAQNTLPMPAALALAPVRSETDLSGRFDGLWKNYKGPLDLQEWIGQNLSDSDAREQYAKLAGLALSKIIENADKRNLANALLEEIRRRPALEPAEFHFLSMYLHLYEKELPDGADRPKPELLQLALRARRQAEEVAVAASGADEKDAPPFHPYSEQVFPWIAAQVEKADRERRLGEDLLFASRPFSDQAQFHLNNAENAYEQAKKIATDVRKALEVRDRVLADLPYYAQWLTRRPGKVPETSLERAQRIGDATHALVQLLAQPSRDTESLRKHGDEIETNFSELRNAMAACTRESLNEDQDVQTVWDEIQALLSVPLVKPSERIGLVKKLERVAAKLGDFASEEAASQKEIARTEDAQTADRVRELAHRQERMALAVLPQGSWRTRSPHVGKEISSYLQALPGSIDKLTSQALTEDLNDAVKDLREADYLARLLDGAGAQALNKGYDPCGEKRNVNLHNLLLWQAQRSFKDHWWGHDQKGKPYYQLACEAYLQDAQDLAAPEARGLEASKKVIRLSQVRALQKLLANTKELQFKDPTKHVDLTTDPVASVRFGLEASEELLPAFPVLWRTIDSSLLSLEGGKMNERFPKADFGGAKPATQSEDSFEVKNKGLEKDEQNPALIPSVERTNVALNVLYRGHIITSVPSVTIHHGADITRLRYPEPPYAGLALWADEKTLELLSLSQGALDIVIDYSGSMATMLGDKRKIDHALAALGDVLRDLPEGVRLGVWVFGDKDVLDITPKKDWVRRIWAPRPWHPAQLEDLMTLLKLNPRSFTPLVRAMTLAARADLKEFHGPKILLVLTDGMDTRFVKQDTDAGNGTTAHTEGDPDFNRGSKGNEEEIRKFLREEFQDSDITINMVLFNPPNETEKEIAHRQFEVIEEFPQRGKLYDARDTNELRKNLKLSLVQELRCKIERDDKPVRPEEGLEIMASGKNPSWFPERLRPGQYTGVIRDLRQQMRFEKGDFLYATLMNKRLQRTVVGQRDMPDLKRKQMSSSGEWLLAVMQDQLRSDRNRSLQMLVTIEKLPGHGEGGVLKQIKPNFTWFELKPQGVKQRVSLRWQNPDRYPAYAAGLDVPEWPMTSDGGSAIPELHAWWTSEEPKAHGRLRLKDVLGASPTSPRPVKLDSGEIVTIERCQIVERGVQGAADEKPSNQSCLVVRIRHPHASPVLARLKPDMGGQEDRFYQQANTYTGIFWSVQKSQTEDLALELISLQKIKNDAGTEKCTLTKLPEPDPKEDRDRCLQRAPDIRPR